MQKSSMSKFTVFMKQWAKIYPDDQLDPEVPLGTLLCHEAMGEDL